MTIFFVHEGPVENLEKDKYENRISEDEAYASAWIYGYRVDENGDVLGSVECNVGASQYNNQDGVNVVQFYAYADSRLLDWDLKGTANAWVKLPNRVRAGPGRDVDIGNGHPSHYLRTEDSYIVNTNQVRGRRIEASAKLRVKKATVRVQVTAVRA